MKVIAADGEMRASSALAEASGVIESSPAAIKLRYLQVRAEWVSSYYLHSDTCRPSMPVE